MAHPRHGAERSRSSQAWYQEERADAEKSDKSRKNLQSAPGKHRPGNRPTARPTPEQVHTGDHPEQVRLPPNRTRSRQSLAPRITDLSLSSTHGAASDTAWSGDTPLPPPNAWPGARLPSLAPGTPPRLPRGRPVIPMFGTSSPLRTRQSAVLKLQASSHQRISVSNLFPDRRLDPRTQEQRQKPSNAEPAGGRLRRRFAPQPLPRGELYVQSMRDTQPRPGLSERSEYPCASGMPEELQQVSDVDYFVRCTRMFFQNQRAQHIVLSRNRLSTCPHFEENRDIAFISLRHNQLTRLSNVWVFPNLVSLDLHDNMLETLAGLQRCTSLLNLRVSKNRLTHINFLHGMARLQSLDLQANMIRKIENLGHMQNLVELNLAANRITIVDNLEGLAGLEILHADHNRVSHAVGLDQLPKLGYLNMSVNQIRSYSDVGCIGRCIGLHTLMIGGNPLAMYGGYDLDLIDKMASLLQLDGQPITDEDRARAQAQAAALEAQRATMLREEQFQLSRIRAKEHWQLKHAESGLEPCRESRRKELESSHDIIKEKRVPPCAFIMSGKLSGMFAGCGSVSTLSCRGITGYQDVDITLNFEFVTVDEIMQHRREICKAFPRIKGMGFVCNDIRSLPQVDAILREFPDVTFLNIASGGNPLCQVIFWKQYVAYQSTGGRLEMLNGEVITEELRQGGMQRFGVLADLFPSSTWMKNLSADDTCREHPRQTGKEKSESEPALAGTQATGRAERRASDSKPGTAAPRMRTHNGYDLITGTGLLKKEKPGIKAVDDAMQSSIRRHCIEEEFRTISPRLVTRVLVDAVLKVHNIKCYEEQAMEQLLSGYRSKKGT